MIAQRTLVLTLLSFVLAACGGGGGGGASSGGDGGGGGGGGSGGGFSPPPASSGPSAQDLSNAQNARMHMRLMGPDLTVSWLDTFSNELDYRVEYNTGTGYVLLGTLSPVDGGRAQWHGSITSSGTYRVLATLPGGVSVPLPVAPNENEVRVDLPQSLMLIQLGAPEPILDAVEVSIPNVGSALSVSYYLDQARIAKVTGGNAFATTLPAQNLVRGWPELRAEIERSPGLTEVTSRSLFVANQSAAVHLRVAPAQAITNALELKASASSATDIVSVQFFANGNSLQTLIEPNVDTQWVYHLDPASLPAGVNTFRAVATDTNGRTALMDAEYNVDPATPTLTLEGLFDGMIAPASSFDVRGSFAAPGGDGILTLEIIGGRTLLRTRTSPFSAQFSLADLPGGQTISVRVEDSAGRLKQHYFAVTAATTTRPYELIATDAAQLLAADAGALLYKKNSGAVVLRNANGSETEVQVPPGASFSKWWLSQGRILAQERINLHVHLFTGPGQTTDLSAQLMSAPRAYPKVRGPWISWTTGEGYGPFVVYNFISSTGGYAGPTDSMNVYTVHELLPTPGNERLLYIDGTGATRGIYEYTLGSGAIRQLISGQYWEIRSDGDRLAFSNNRVLRIASLNDPGANSLVSDNMLSFALDAGLLCWNTHDFKLYVDDGTATTLLSEGHLGMGDYTIKDGNIVFTENQRLYSWSRTAGKHLLMDYAGGQMMQTQGTAYLRTGRNGALYRVTMP